MDWGWGAGAANVALFLWLMASVASLAVPIVMDGFVTARLHERGVDADL